MGGFLCLPRITPSTSTRLPAEIGKKKKKVDRASVFSLLCGTPGKFQVFCLQFEQDFFYTFRLWGNRNVPMPEACLVVGVCSLLFTLMGGGNLTQGSKITAQHEAKSWKLFAEAGLRFCSP